MIIIIYTTTVTTTITTTTTVFIGISALLKKVVKYFRKTITLHHFEPIIHKFFNQRGEISRLTKMENHYNQNYKYPSHLHNLK